VSERPIWASSNGLPTVHAIKAALQVARIVDDTGSVTADARKSYWVHAAGENLLAADLQVGERLLVDISMIVERDGLLIPSAELKSLIDSPMDYAIGEVYNLAFQNVSALRATASAPTVIEAVSSLNLDPEVREAMLLSLKRRYDDSLLKTLGEFGERIALDAFRLELLLLGYKALAQSVRRVSLVSDQLGYDITAPRVSGLPRRVEVKATTCARDASEYCVYISRNEADFGSRNPDWSLLVVHVLDSDSGGGEVIGWCNASAIESLLPEDSDSGAWVQARIRLPSELLRPGIPNAF